MTPRQKIWTEAVHGWLHKCENRLDFPGKITAEDFYDHNKKAIDAIFYEMRMDLQVPMTKGMHKVLLWGIESYLKAEGVLPQSPTPDTTIEDPMKYTYYKKK
jgi:hypothetical protein